MLLPNRGIALGLIAITAAACGDGDASTVDATAAVADAASPLPGITFYDYAIAVDVSPDGNAAVFEDLSTAEVLLVTVNTATGALGTPVDAGDPSLDVATGVANGGRISAVHGNPAQAGIYDPTAAAWQDLASPYATDCDPNAGGSFDINGDGSVAVGLMWNGCSPVAFRWTDGAGAGTTQQLDVLGASSQSGTQPTNRATVVSDDGLVTAGFAENLQLDRSAAIWTADGHGMLIDAVQQDAPSEFLSISADGSVLAGTFGFDGFVFTQTGGMVTLPRPDASLPSDPVFPNAMTADGTVVFGGVGDAFSSIPIAFMWSQANATRQLLDVVTAANITVPTGTLLNSVLGVSADGTVLIGTAMNAAGANKTYLLRLPASSID